MSKTFGLSFLRLMCEISETGVRAHPGAAEALIRGINLVMES